MRTYNVRYTMHEADLDRSIDVLANSKAEAYDKAVYELIPEKEKSEGTDPVPNSDESGNTLVSNSEGQSILKEIRKNVEKPAIVEILRSIY